MKTPNSKTEKHVLASKKHHDHSFLSGSKFNDNSDLPKRLRDMGLSDEDKEKLFALKYYIYKSSQSSIRLFPKTLIISLFTFFHDSAKPPIDKNYVSNFYCCVLIVFI